MSQKELLSARELQITIQRLACQLIENHGDFKETILIGIQPRGKMLAKRLFNVLVKDYHI